MDNLSPQQIKQMIEMLKSMLPQDENYADTSDDSPPTPEPIKPQKKLKRDFVNKFDQMQEAKLHKDDIAVDKALSVYSPTPRTRQFDPVEAVCRVCGKKEKVNPAILYDSPQRFKCNNCSRSPG